MSRIDIELIKEDIINGISFEEFNKKYSLKRSSYQKYKQRFIPQYHREYTRLVNLDSFISYAKDHSIRECAQHFNIKERRAYKYKEEAITKGLI